MCRNLGEQALPHLELRATAATARAEDGELLRFTLHGTGARRSMGGGDDRDDPASRRRGHECGATVMNDGTSDAVSDYKRVRYGEQ